MEKINNEFAREKVKISGVRFEWKGGKLKSTAIKPSLTWQGYVFMVPRNPRTERR